MQHNVRFEAGDARELFIAHRTGEVRRRVCGLVQSEVKIHVECLWALVTSMRLQRTEDNLKKVVNDANLNQLGHQPLQSILIVVKFHL